MRDADLQGLAVGFFDGVHLGHQAILKEAKSALTFRNHPLAVLAPERAPRLIMTCEQRIAAIRACGIEDVTVLDFTQALADMPADDFVRECLLAVRGCKGLQRVVCGENWRFGKGGIGDAAFLRRKGLAVDVVPYAEYRGERISSSRIRQCLENGEIEDANAMMGRKFRISGIRFQGKGLGRKIGCPTVNLKISEREPDECGGFERIRLRCGVYEVEAAGRRGIANYGLAPTMGERAWPLPVMELHFFGDQAVEQTNDMAVSLVRYIRPERKFDSVADLQRQIVADCESCGIGLTGFRR